MKNKLKDLIINAFITAHQNKELASYDFTSIELEEPKNKAHGDFSTNIAMISASLQKMPPKKIAEIIIKNIKEKNILDKIEIAGPGFINFFIKPQVWHNVLNRIYKEDNSYGSNNLGKGKKVQIEFVSANPTGPLHVGHGRGAAVGDTVSKILSFCGYDVQKEYYINDSGRQINTLGISTFLRYKEIFGQIIQFPQDCYQGDYIRDIAYEIKAQRGDKLLKIDEIEAIKICAIYSADKILQGIADDLLAFGVTFDRWYSEQSLYDSGKVENAIKNFREKEIIYEKDGALWFTTTKFGDEKDRVVVRKNGQTTYFAADIAYHKEKFERGFDRVIDVWGADHHGYIPRLSACIEASGYNKKQFHVILIYLVNLLRGGEPVAMSTRTGEFVTLQEVVNEVGKDAARFIFLTRHYESPLDFDIEIAKKKSNDNPVYYVQYVHARISSIIKKAQESGIISISWDEKISELIKEYEEIELLKNLSRFPEVVEISAENLEPHRITFYLIDLASCFHAYYNKHKVLNDDINLTNARLYLITAVQKVIRNGLNLLGVLAPERM